MKTGPSVCRYSNVSYIPMPMSIQILGGCMESGEEPSITMKTKIRVRYKCWVDNLRHCCAHDALKMASSNNLLPLHQLLVHSIFRSTALTNVMKCIASHRTHQKNGEERNSCAVEYCSCHSPSRSRLLESFNKSTSPYASRATTMPAIESLSPGDTSMPNACIGTLHEFDSEILWTVWVFTMPTSWPLAWKGR